MLDFPVCFNFNLVKPSSQPLTHCTIQPCCSTSAVSLGYLSIFLPYCLYTVYKLNKVATQSTELNVALVLQYPAGLSDVFSNLQSPLSLHCSKTCLPQNASINLFSCRDKPADGFYFVLADTLISDWSLYSSYFSAWWCGQVYWCVVLVTDT